ncbi:MAG TPA: tRNA (adenosine(37)-N6)-dimethylallyltransferase MiaA [Deltaproteobacteria bacterium]|nr:tRNA (adenosine(37)-N6)-dimethylallyltransferase MiaA [Deltaproteobacteria bacterium]
MDEEGRLNNLPVILGPTASGKTALAVRFARYAAAEHAVNCEIISADSRQVYRRMDIGTGKDREQFFEGGTAVPCHLVDLVDPDYEFNLFEYRHVFSRTFSDIRNRGHLPVMVGGTGLYIEAVIEGYDLPPLPAGGERLKELLRLETGELRRRLLAFRPEPHNTTDLLDRERLARAVAVEEARRTDVKGDSVRPDVNAFVIGIRVERSELRRRILRRLEERIDRGMIDEVRALHDSGLEWDRLDRFGLEYRYISRYLRGELTLDEMVKTLAVKIGQFAKRQETWFRRMERKGIVIHWVDADDFQTLRRLLEDHMPEMFHGVGRSENS